MKKRMLVSLFCGLSLFLVVLFVGTLRHIAIVEFIFPSFISGTISSIIVFVANGNCFDDSGDSDHKDESEGKGESKFADLEH